MIKYLFSLVLTCMLLAQPGQAQHIWTKVEIQSLLKRADAYRMPLEQGRVLAGITLVKNGIRSRTLPMRIEFSAKRERRIETLGGARKGQRVLLTPEGYWLYMTGIKQPVRLNRLQRVLGQASFGDIGNLRFAEDYQAQNWNEENGLIRIVLAAHMQGQVVDNITLWIDPQTGAPVRASLLFPSGKTFKILNFDPPQPTPAGAMILSTRFVDPTQADVFTELTYAPPESTGFAPTYFTPTALVAEKE
ncbi:outer membrane lipoprotein-sorting protein [Sulfitobacter sp. F26204]|uniref:outer membrane lipoprotein-sorting protein n=1 Tax=Sulfitobacter sp. F26204 TaxID=2996014 RepID=UPI00225E4D1A|nr:outer membrane lipoprotein-sorting protein [Sulfitobacter sp. F26204]MCX7560548.1 outer membrane lipoprotein-sorting protein [Sulfitobacter sp. F26204]